MIGQNGKNSSNRLRPTQGYNAIRRLLLLLLLLLLYLLFNKGPG
jgi:hypothetical protein